jgi:hypothetical protein
MWVPKHESARTLPVYLHLIWIVVSHVQAALFFIWLIELFGIALTIQEFVLKLTDVRPWVFTSSLSVQ